MKCFLKCNFLLKCLLLGAFLFEFASSVHSSIIQRLRFEEIETLKGISTSEVLKVYQDREGFIWIATRYGLFKYDGYQVRSYKSNIYTPELLTNNVISCLADDYDHNLWIGTSDGVNVLNKITGEIQKIHIPTIYNNNISCILVTKDNRVWLGTDSGLCLYLRKNNTFKVFTNSNTNNVLTTTAIKSLFEDSRGDIWIGTWDKGLYRYSPKQNKFYAYPKMNSRNSAHVVFEDQQGNIWVGSWEFGLFKLKNPRDMKRVTWQNYTHHTSDANSLSNNIIYDISEDSITQTLWVGTRNGLSIMPLDNPGTFYNYQPRGSSYYMPFTEVSSVMQSRQSFMWVGTVGGGVYRVDTHVPFFSLVELNFKGIDIPSRSALKIMIDHEGTAWMGVSGYGLVRCNRDGSNLKHYTQIPEFAGITSISDVNAIMQRKNGEIWFGLVDGQILIYKRGQKVRVVHPEKSSFITFPLITSLMEDASGNCWIGTRSGLGVMYPNGKGHIFEPSVRDTNNYDQSYVQTILEDREGTIWLGSRRFGVARLQGDVCHPSSVKLTAYNWQTGKMPDVAVFILYQDRAGRIWAGTEGGGLFLFNVHKDCFESVSARFKIQMPDVVSGIEEDRYGSLWLSTNEGLIKLTFSPDKEPTIRIYTSADGLNNFYNAFGTGSSQWDGELFFAGSNGFNAFYPKKIEEPAINAPVVITDIKIFDKSFLSLDEEVRQKISKQMPEFTKRIVIPNKYNNFTIEFAALTFNKVLNNRYAYKLEGFDEDWQCTSGNRHFAYYNNLASGTYRFLLKAANANGVWNEEVKELEIIVLPPWWATWWAFLIYAILIWGAILYVMRSAKHRLLLQNQLKLSNLEQAKSEELNHAKLQFFTNITHELLTPLTIISAAVDELKLQMPMHQEYYSVMTRNITRLIRLLQQILEFRKAESGNLKLRVSPGDLVAFLQNEIEAFRPLIKKRKLHLSVLCDPERIQGYFDTDKLDKIVYNLLSNAAKYNEEGGFIHVDIRSKDQGWAELIVKDNGKGLSEEEQKTLFTRFYEGDYRRHNTIGTGIGLSLTKDLILLHGGNIHVESALGKGTTFIVRLPIDRNAFLKDQIDDEAIIPHQTIVGLDDDSTNKEEELECTGKENLPTILVVEDNEELLHLVVRLLGSEYNVFYALNGKEGLDFVEREEINLIVTDVMMPIMDGIEFCKRIKSSFDYCHIPVIMLTAKTKEEDRTEAYEVGADGYITKPFTLSVLHAKIKSLLRNRARNASDFKKQVVFEIKELNYTSLDEDFLKRAINCVHKHLDDSDFDQPQMMDELGAAKSTLYKKLKSLTGLNPSAFIRNIRLKAACQIIEEKKRVRISELAYAVGFRDAKYFSSCFRKEFGIQPKEYMSRFVSSDSLSEEDDIDDD